MTAVPTHSTFELCLLAFLALVLLACGALLLVPAPADTPDQAAQRQRERLVDAAHAWAPDHGEPVTSRRKGAA